MDLWRSLLVLTSVFVSYLQSVSGLKCYSCVSTIAGCGKELNIRLQRWHSCPSPPSGSGENFCVKMIKKTGGEAEITRGCLQTLRDQSYHRARMPTVQRHGYCEPARNNDPNDPNDESMIYCFCNDYNGCNKSSGLRAKALWMILPTVLVCVASRLFS